MLRPVAALVAARTRRRGATTLLAIAAIAMAAALVAIVAGIGLVAADATLARALDATGVDRPVVRVSDFSSSGRDADTTEAMAARSLAGLDEHTDPVIRGVLFHQLIDQHNRMVDLIAAVDDPTPWLQLTEGRAPAPCIDGVRCEAVLLAETATDEPITVAVPTEGMELTIVGRGQLDPAIPFGDLDQSGPVGDEPGGGQYQTSRASPAVLLVNGVDAIAHSPLLEGTGRTYVWAAPLDVDAIHPWTASAFRSASEQAGIDLRVAGLGYTMTSPANLVRDELIRADAAAGRLLLIGSLGVAILLAFAVYLALVTREDTLAELARLAAVGARRRDRLGFLLLEAAFPAVIGGIIGWIFGGLVVGALAASSDVDPVAVIVGTLLSPGALLAMLAVLVAAVAVVVMAMAPGRSMGAIRIAGAVGITAVVILGWQLSAGGSIGANILARSLASPVVVLLPPVLAFVLALGFVATLPAILRALARRARSAPLPVRLSLLSVSREPARPAATLTLLAFSLGAIVFAAGWSASLSRGIEDAAAYRSGLDLRVAELGTGLSISASVVPTDRYAALGDDIRAVPVYRDTAPNHPDGRVDIVGIDPEVLATLPGWRSDFSATPMSELAASLHMPEPPGGWAVKGHRLDPAASDLTLDFDYAGKTLRLDAIVTTDDGDGTTVRMGDVSEGMTSISAPLPDGARGGLLTALIFRNPGLVAGSGHQDELRRATVTFHGLDGLTPATARELEIFTTSTEIIKAPQVTDDLRLPAIVSPDLAATAIGGQLDLVLTSQSSVPLEIVGVATHMPSVVDPEPRFVAVPLQPWLISLLSAVPGAGRPTEMWLDLPDGDPAREAQVRAQLAKDPFRFAEVTSRIDLVAERAGDPLSRAIVWTLVVAALAGLALSIGGLILGTVTDLRDERGELADLEAQGLGPRSLRGHVMARTAWLAIGGGVAGLAVGVVLTVVVTAALALTAEGEAPIPPLIVVIPWPIILAIVGGVLAIVLGVAWFLVRRSFGRRTLGERRAGAVDVGPTWATSGERADG
jgi:hypothetical protein